MLWVNTPLAIICLVTVTALTLFINVWVAPRTRSGFRAQQAALGRSTGWSRRRSAGSGW